MNTNLRGLLDATLETVNWCRNIRCIENLAEVNVQQFFKDGYVSLSLQCLVIFANFDYALFVSAVVRRDL